MIRSLSAVVEPARPSPATGPVAAVMQPYFYPYLGYFRLLAVADVFVVLDDVQFPRRGRVHRTQISPTAWLTLPLARQPRDVPIRDLAFAPDARARLDERLDRLAWLAGGAGPLAGSVREQLRAPLSTPAAFLQDALGLMAQTLELPARIVSASSLAIAPEVRGQDRIIALAQAVGAKTYVNAPGGRALYARSAFEQAGLELRFLPPYTGHVFHLLPALMSESPDALRRDLEGQTALVP